MITIPLEVIVLLGLLACLREMYSVFKEGKKKNLGSLFALYYITFVYALLAWGHLFGITFHGSIPVRLGILLIFTDKVFTFAYEIYSRRRKWTQ